jgi:hypothetical protein
LPSTKVLVRHTGGELLSVGYEMPSARDGVSKILTLWNSSEFMDETGEGASEQAPQPLSKKLLVIWGNNLPLP